MTVFAADPCGFDTSAELAAATDANPNTLKLRLRELVGDGRVVRRGKGRATWYSLPTGRS